MRGAGPFDALVVCTAKLQVTAGRPAVAQLPRSSARRLGLPVTPGALTRRSAPWRPWRAYAVQHLWATGEHPVNSLPGSAPGG